MTSTASRFAIARVAVVGAGTIGPGVAQCVAESGLPVLLIDCDPAALDRSRQRIGRDLRLGRLLAPRSAGDGQAPPDPAKMLERITFGTQIHALAEVDLVIENITEDVGVKLALYASLDDVCRPETVFAANTSAISIAKLAAATERPDRVVGMHFMNPAPATSAVEVVRGAETSGRTLELATCFLHRLGKRVVLVNDGPGFVINRVLMTMINEAAGLVADGVADPATTDEAFRECLGHRMGPLETADLIGLDNVVDTMAVLDDAMPGRHRSAHALLQAHVRSGRLGRKSGAGFYEYVTGTVTTAQSPSTDKAEG